MLNKTKAHLRPRQIDFAHKIARRERRLNLLYNILFWTFLGLFWTFLGMVAFAVGILISMVAP